MKIHVMSDIHLEMNSSVCSDITKNLPEADVLVLAGDILTAYYASYENFNRRKFINFFDVVTQFYKYVLVVMGNHEYYHYNLDETYNDLEKFYEQWDNIFLMENETFTLYDTLFIGSTLWTDFLGDSPLSKAAAQQGMNDYRIIFKTVQKANEETGDRKVERRLTPDDTHQLHVQALDFITDELESLPGNIKNVVMITHHCPTAQSIDPQFADDVLMNGAYYSELTELIQRYTNKIKFWFHGHVHCHNDYMIGDTRVISNARGYGPSEWKTFDPNLVVEVI